MATLTVTLVAGTFTVNVLEVVNAIGVIAAQRAPTVDRSPVAAPCSCTCQRHIDDFRLARVVRVGGARLESHRSAFQKPRKMADRAAHFGARGDVDQRIRLPASKIYTPFVVV